MADQPIVASSTATAALVVGRIHLFSNSSELPKITMATILTELREKTNRPGGQSGLIFATVSLLSARVSLGQAGPGSFGAIIGTAASNGGVALNLAMTSPAGSEPSAIEWALTYPPANVVSISVSPERLLPPRAKH